MSRALAEVMSRMMHSIFRNFETVRNRSIWFRTTLIGLQRKFLNDFDYGDIERRFKFRRDSLLEVRRICLNV